MSDEARYRAQRPPIWLGVVPAIRAERHFDGRVVRCFSDRPKSTFALLADAIGCNPEGEAIVCAGERVTYRRFGEIVSGWTSRLERLGVARGDRVAMLLGNGIAFPAVLFATLRLGAIAVPISIREQTPGLAYMLAHCGAKALVYEADLAARLPQTAATPHLGHRLAISPKTPLGGLGRLEEGSGATTPPADVDEEDAAIILYTSGTTGSFTHPARPGGPRGRC